ncbi:MAG TPA: hypothetical protein VGM54_08555 [Chthoniobacter sp.]|jgi:hypothetical protein
MAISSHNRNQRSKPWIRFILWSIPIGFVVLVVIYFVAKSAIDSYLRSDGFRQFVARKAGDTLHADAELTPLTYSGSNIFADNFHAQGGPDAAFAKLDVEQIRTELSLRKFFEKVWEVDQFDVQRVRVNFEGPRANRPPEPTTSPLNAPKVPDNSTGWLPNRVEIGKATIHDAELTWNGGGLHDTALEISPYEGGWQIVGQGGKLDYAKLPQLEVANLHLRYHAPSLFLNNVELRQPKGGALMASGEVNFSHKLDIALKLTNIDIYPYLSDDWRLRAKGNLSGDVTVRSDLPVHGGPELSGSLHLAQGELTALPVLDEIATFTRTRQFNHLNLSNASGDFTRDDTRLHVKNFVAESDGLIRVEGEFTIENGNIDGDFQVGVTPGSLQFLPGSQAKVFTVSRGGYVWAPMHLSGPANKPTEDLSPRLIAAAQGAVIEGVQNAAGEAIKTGKDAAKGILDLLLTPPAK